MATEPDAAAGTPKRRNPTHQEITDRGTPITLSSPIPCQPAQKRARHTQPTPIARPDLLRTTGRSQRATDIHTGLDASIHAHANTATDSLTQVLREQDRRLNTTRTVLKLVASSLDNITATCDHDLKGHAEKIITLFTSFLKATILEPNNNPDALAPAPDGKTWAQTAQPTRAMQPTQTIQEPPRKKAQHGTAKNTKDLPIFARIPDEYRDGIKAHTNFALRHTICKQLSIPITDIPDVHHIATGLAIRPKDQATRAKILAKKDLIGRHLKATKLETPETWYTYAVAHCPKQIPIIQEETRLPRRHLSSKRRNSRLQRPTKKELAAIRRLGRKQYQAKNLPTTTESDESANNATSNGEDAASEHSDTTIPDLPAEKTGEAEDATDEDMDFGPPDDEEDKPLIQETKYRRAG
ncbi:hypothetical protein ACJZ2D_016295 [Fusarium nematophilum]